MRAFAWPPAISEYTEHFRRELSDIGLTVRTGTHPIVPVMLNDANLAKQMPARPLELGIYVISFSFPVVPKELARIRVQIAAAHTKSQLDRALAAFSQVAKELKLV